MFTLFRSILHPLMKVSTGGNIALGLGQQGWSVSDATSIVTNSAKQAFTAHKDLLQSLKSVYDHGQYGTVAIEEAFQEAFSREAMLFGEAHGSEAVRTKALMVTTSFRNQVMLISNYSRKTPRGRK